MGIDIQQWRCRIGSFHQDTKKFSREQVLRFISLKLPNSHPLVTVLFLCSILLLSGDVESNPGPRHDINGGQSNEKARTRKRKQYNLFVGDDDPWLSIPRTSKWRLKRNQTYGNSNCHDERTSISQGADQGDVDCGDIITDKTSETPEHSSALDLDSESQSDHELDSEVADHIDSVTDQGEDVDITHEDERPYEESTDVLPEEIWYDASEENILLDEDLEPEVEHDDNKPIYEGASITTGQSALLILSLAFRHSLTGECISDILTCVSLHCLRKNSIHSSLYKFRKYFSGLKANLKLHSYCQKCDYLLTQDNRICPVCSLETDESSTYFVEIPVEEQINELFRRKSFHNLILHRFERKKKCGSCVEDIYDGELYRKYSRKDAFLDSKYNISLMWYTDGVPLFASSKVSLWPMYFAINELPYKERVKPENLLFAGMWYGKSKPSMSTFLKPIHETMDKLNRHGVYVECNHCNEKFTSKALILCGTCDLPAKCMMLNMTQFNGKFGCPRCIQPGEVVPTGKGHTRVFPFDEENVDGPCRTHKNFIQHGEQAFETNSITYGVKGPSWLTAISADAIQGTSIDYMHTVLLGLIRRLLTLWFDSKFSSGAFSVSKLVHKTDGRLATIKPPHFVTRLPRSILEHSKYWKASECRSWLFYYSVPVLFGILDPVYFHHYLLFYEAMYVLNLDSISQEDLQHCDELIITFCCQFSALYGKEHMSANLHQLLHLKEVVKQLGPLWIHSCFSFESMNGKLLHFFHGTQSAVIQISDAVTSLMRIPKLSESMENDQESPAGQLYQKLTCKKRQHGKVFEVIAENVFVIGSLRRQNIMEIYSTAIMEFVGKALLDTFVFYRLLLNGCMYFSSHYKVTKRNSFTVKYMDNRKKEKFGQVMFFAKCYLVCGCVEKCDCYPEYLAVIRQKVQRERNDVRNSIIKANLRHLHSGILTDNYVAVPVRSLLDLCVFMNTDVNETKRVFITYRPNTQECD